MYQNDAEVLFLRASSLHSGICAGEKWQKLVEHVMQRPENDADLLAFIC